MDDVFKKQVSELVDVCNLNANAVHRYRLIKPILDTSFGQPEIDLLRTEVSICYITNAAQACITTINHLLERYCKLLLIYKDAGFTSVSKLEGLEELFEPGIKRYAKKDLSETLSACKKKGLIDKATWKKLDEHREQFRNGFSHADPDKILGEAKGTFTLASFDGSTESETRSLQFSKIPFLQGYAIQQLAQSLSLFYFVDVENFIRQTINNIQPDQHKRDYRFVFIEKRDPGENLPPNLTAK